jgi:dATP pyrophosphohydrolase
MTMVRASIVDVYPLRGSGAGLEVLCLRRAADTRCGGSWEVVHGHVEGEESPVAAALRELREETGVDAERLYNLSRVESFYLHRSNEIALIPVFVAFLDPAGGVRLSAEHDAHEWMNLEQASGTAGLAPGTPRPRGHPGAVSAAAMPGSWKTCSG